MLVPFLGAQEEEGEQRFERRIVWGGGYYALRYAVEIDKVENGSYQSHIREYTESLFFDVSLPPGEYRYRIIPHDILDRPGGGSQWIYFAVSIMPDIHIAQEEPIEEIPVEEFITEQPEETPFQTAAAEPQPEIIGSRQLAPGQSARFNTLGVSLGTTYADPLLAATVFGTLAIANNIYLEAGFEFGSISLHNYVDSLFTIYPYLNLGYFWPFQNSGGFFISFGYGVITSYYNYSPPLSSAESASFCVNINAGVNIANFFNLSYTFKTNYSGVSNKLAVGLVYRFF